MRRPLQHGTPRCRYMQHGAVSHANPTIDQRTCQPDHVESHVVESVYDVHVQRIASFGHLRLPDVAELACFVHKDVREAAYLRGAKGRILCVI